MFPGNYVWALYLFTQRNIKKKQTQTSKSLSAAELIASTSWEIWNQVFHDMICVELQLEYMILWE